MYDVIDMKHKYNLGFWQGAIAATIFWIVFIPSSLYVMGYFG